jgi:hypothetical protein
MKERKQREGRVLQLMPLVSADFMLGDGGGVFRLDTSGFIRTTLYCNPEDRGLENLDFQTAVCNIVSRIYRQICAECLLFFSTMVEHFRPMIYHFHF